MGDIGRAPCRLRGNMTTFLYLMAGLMSPSPLIHLAESRVEMTPQYCKALSISQDHPQVFVNQQVRTRAVRIPLMPQGVEHWIREIVADALVPVRIPLMPQGVEHARP